MALSVLSGVLCVLMLGHCSPIPPADNRDMQEVLGQFLQMLNMTDPRSRTRAEAPDYMLELYNRFASDRSAAPPANIIRSFRNEVSVCSSTSSVLLKEHSTVLRNHTSHGVTSISLRTHQLMFNVSVPQHERVISAELRLHTLLDRVTRPRIETFLERETHPRIETLIERVTRPRIETWKLSVFDIRRDERYERNLLASKHVHRKDSGWEVFDITDAVLHWRKLNIMTPRLEVHIENLNALRNTNIDLDIDWNGKNEPALIVFSDDPKDAHRTNEEDNNLWTDEEKQDETLLTQLRSNEIYEDGSRIRRNADNEDCKIAEMYVDFKDIKWDSFILAPAGYQAFTCRGVCNFPLTQRVTPTKHAIVQTLLNLKSSERAPKACCVPTELKPISLLYLKENGVVELNNKYEGMVVKECGCR